MKYRAAYIVMHVAVAGILAWIPMTWTLDLGAHREARSVFQATPVCETSGTCADAPLPHSALDRCWNVVEQLMEEAGILLDGAHLSQQLAGPILDLCDPLNDKE